MREPRDRRRNPEPEAVASKPRVTVPTEVIGNLRVAEGFLGTVARWQYQPGIDLHDEIERASRGVRDALIGLGCEASPIGVPRPREYFEKRSDD